MNFDNITLVARWVGFGLIVLCWMQVIPLLVGWIGLGIAGISFIFEQIYNKNMATPNAESGQGDTHDQINKDN